MCSSLEHCLVSLEPVCHYKEFEFSFPLESFKQESEIMRLGLSDDNFDLCEKNGQIGSYSFMYLF
jgi:hypothetical protein